MKSLKKMRIDAGLSQLDVSKKLGYSSPQFISNIERGLALPPTKILKPLAKICKVNFEDLKQLKLKALLKQKGLI